MFRSGKNNRLRDWLVKLILLAMIVPASGMYALPDQQAANSVLPPCHQSQQQDEQISAKSTASKSCCDSLHECSGNCIHDCTDCFSNGQVGGLIIFSDELQQSKKIYIHPVSSYNNGVSPTLLLRPPRQPG